MDQEQHTLCCAFKRRLDHIKRRMPVLCFKFVFLNFSLVSLSNIIVLFILFVSTLFGFVSMMTTMPPQS